jgi:hypothetical protein
VTKCARQVIVVGVGGGVCGGVGVGGGGFAAAAIIIIIITSMDQAVLGLFRIPE